MQYFKYLPSTAIILLMSFSFALAQPEGDFSVSTFSIGSSAPEIHFDKTSAGSVSLSTYFNKNRIVLLFVPASFTSEADEYLSKLSKKSDDLIDRNLQIIVVVPTQSPLLQKDYGHSVLLTDKSDVMPASFSINGESAPLFILIGKDRTIKLREKKFVLSAALFDTIDAMPMRRLEKKICL